MTQHLIRPIAINSNITQMSTLHRHRAAVAAGDSKAIDLVETCAKAGVTILSSTPSWKDMKAGQSIAVTQLARLLNNFGSDVLIDALLAITKTRDGNPGMLRGNVIHALCVVVEAEPAWRGKKLIKAMQNFDLPAAFARARADQGREGKWSLTASLVDILCDYLDKAIPEAA